MKRQLAFMKRARIHSSMKIPSKSELVVFWSRVQTGRANQCWPWKLGVTAAGYGRMRINGKLEYAHRIAFISANGPTSLLVCHTCDNPRCCNPAHLFAGTNEDNLKDMARKGRGATGLRSGAHTHPESRPRGIKNGLSKLDDETVLNIRRRYSRGCVTQKALAEESGVDQSLISLIVRRKIWTHL